MMRRQGKRTLCIIFEAIGPYSAIGRIAMRDVQIAIKAGWQVTVVAKFLDESLRESVKWLRLYVPSRLFYLQWTTARYFIRKAIGGRAFDVVHAHQPQVADMADIFQCHYLTRAAYERKSLSRCDTLRSALVRLQEQGVLYAEDRHYRNWNPDTKMLYDSDLTRDDFHRLYGSLPSEEVFLYAFPPLQFPTDEERKAARLRWIGSEPNQIVLGYLGGLHERKGYRRLIHGLAGHNDVFLLMGGSYTEGFSAPALGGHFKSVGLVSDIASFYHACDVFIVPSHYEPFGLVAMEAVAHGVPVIATEEVGALPHLRTYGVGATWRPTEPLAEIVHRLAAQRAKHNDAARAMHADLGIEQYSERLLQVYDQALQRKRGVHQTH